MTIDMQLAAIRESYGRARAEADSRALHAPGKEPAGRCRYCGTARIRFATARIDGHGRCIVPPWFRSQIRVALASTPTLSIATVAAELGVSPHVVRAWWHETDATRGAP